MLRTMLIPFLMANAEFRPFVIPEKSSLCVYACVYFVDRMLYHDPLPDSYFYRAMHFSAKRGIAIACRLSVRLSVCLSVCL